VVVNMASFGMDPQTALDAPRVCLRDGTADSVVALEEGVPDATLQRLRELGHKVAGPVRGWERSLFGRGQILLRDRATGVIWGGSDGRGDGCVMGW
jgi:gamma-glutamyltranspeptidase / glutathione hydrolase